MPPRWNKIIPVSLPFAALMPAVLQAVQEIPATVSQFDSAGGHLLARTAPTFKSRGEHIKVQVEALGENACQVRIESELVLILTDLQHDWGVNEKNIRTFEKRLEAAEVKASQEHASNPASSPAPERSPTPETSALVQMICAACGARLNALPEAGKWGCVYCGNIYSER